MLRFHQYKTQALFIHIPKTGGSTVNNILTKLFPDAQPVNRLNGKHMGHPFLPFIEKLDAQPTFAFIRHPIAWHESLYKMLRDVYPYHKDFRASGFDPNGIAGFFYEDTFEKFIDNILHLCPDYYSETMSRYLGEMGTELDYLGITEHLNHHLCDILETIGFRINKIEIHKWPRIQERQGTMKWRNDQVIKIKENNKRYLSIWENIEEDGVLRNK